MPPSGELAGSADARPAGPARSWPGNGHLSAQEEHAMQRSRAEVRDQPAAGEAIRERLLAGIPVSERRLALAGQQTAVLEGGDGPPVVLLHGAGEFAASWMRVIPELARAHRVIAPDLPGHGASPAGEPLDAPAVVAWLGELVERTCPSPPALVGHLLGGAIAARFAIDHPDRLGRLVLVDTYGLGRFWPSPRFALAMLAFAARPTEGTQERLFRQCTFDLEELREQLGERGRLLEAYALDRARAPGANTALKHLMPQLGVPAIPPAELARIAVPTTLIWGRHDRQVRLGLAEAASARYGWPLHVVEQAADDPAVEQPEAFLRALRGVLGSA
jgi:pimeloyl-ACP methyl ester carboxylesterase